MALTLPNGNYVRVSFVRMEKPTNDSYVFVDVYENQAERTREKNDPSNEFIKKVEKHFPVMLSNLVCEGTDLWDSLQKMSYKELKKLDYFLTATDI